MGVFGRGSDPQLKMHLTPNISNLSDLTPRACFPFCRWEIIVKVIPVMGVFYAVKSQFKIS